MSTDQAEPPGLVFCCSKNMTGEYALFSISALFQDTAPSTLAIRYKTVSHNLYSINRPASGSPRDILQNKCSVNSQKTTVQ